MIAPDGGTLNHPTIAAPTVLAQRCDDPDTGVVVGWRINCPGCRTTHFFRTAATNGYRGPLWTFDGDTARPTFGEELASVIEEQEIYPPDAPPDAEPVRVAGRVCICKVVRGRIGYHRDSTHHLAGQSADLLAFTDAVYS